MAKKDKEQTDTIPEDIAAMSFEAAMAELEDIVQGLEGGQVDLDASIALYSRGALLKRHCEAKLNAASEQVEKIVADGAGKPVATEAADIQ
ncbi:MAG: exodeoxyribonuclease VII small subunit [Rhodospirillaceae bacterium]|jgi:exodeoxyribonuclease VII small subunit|nr:exodeoxyribonuclease VII small subunit [Rhodospirillaceae bacterium]MBT4490726.1 exodeoxyribonuclease VII small subunit [Rhodospirillaceae bacterium]MBT5193271.1 exodeoxyribonuclease VII small subunit [Rhodospirillaceae bacterium]MBT5898085.1 exodeoxyribonuclease VII small subunit [Rhodospirillaceae bacterium]MBT6427379.1 exodeoxyribonuclease VII small subunit [Rhodospirillaceae bacterium]